jgi:hypothetical protein
MIRNFHLERQIERFERKNMFKLVPKCLSTFEEWIMIAIIAEGELCEWFAGSGDPKVEIYRTHLCGGRFVERQLWRFRRVTSSEWPTHFTHCMLYLFGDEFHQDFCKLRSGGR